MNAFFPENRQGLSGSGIPREVDVLIVGGGPVGSALAVDLGIRGISAVTIERNGELLAKNVRARSFTARTMEHVRRWGVDQKLRDSATVPAEWRSKGFVIKTSLAGHVLLHPDPPRKDAWRALTANSNFGVPQYVLTAVLRARALELGNPVFPGWTVTELAQRDEGVSAVIEKTMSGDVRTIRARYVVGADGGRSVVRQTLGIPRTETPVRGIYFNVAVRLPGIFETIGIEPHGLFLLFNPQAQHVFGPFDTERWGFSAGPYPEGTRPEDVDFIREARNRVGTDIPVEIDTVSSFTVQKRIADRFRQGHFMLAGDAAHLFPPFLGQNLNTGIEDVANLGWKLEAVIKGWGGDSLLDSYHEERHFIAHRVADAALARGEELDRNRDFVRAHPVSDDDLSPHAEETRAVLTQYLVEREPRPFDGVALDHRYDHSPIIISDGSAPVPWDPKTYTPSTRPGHRAPHLFLSEGEALYDKFGLGFGLVDLSGEDEDGAVAPLLRAASASGLPLTRVGNLHPGLADLYPARYTLVRPDQYVAWRGDTIPGDFNRIVDVARGFESLDA